MVRNYCFCLTAVSGCFALSVNLNLFFPFFLGLILYNGQQKGGSGDFVSLGLNDGYVEFKFDVGSGTATIKNDRPVSLGRWHTVKLTRSRKDGKKE